jgi:DNA-binding protein HU-beta
VERRLGRSLNHPTGDRGQNAFDRFFVFQFRVKLEEPRLAALDAKDRNMAKAAPTTQAIFTLKHLAAEVAENHGLPKKQAEALLGEVVASIGKQLRKGSKIRIVGLGILQVRKRAARMGRNPQTGEAIKIKASKKIAFRAAKDLKDSI